MNCAKADIVIFGGGIAGLWLLEKLKNSGLSAILLESNTLGGGQTQKSQGIIHGGIKYSLNGVLTKEAKMVKNMPTLWKSCFSGHGEINLSNVNILSHQHYLWSPNKITAKLAGFLAGNTLTSQVATLTRDQYPEIFRHPKFNGEVYSLDEMVIDVPDLIRQLVHLNQASIFKIEPLNGKELVFNSDGSLKLARIYLAGESIDLIAQHFIFLSGAGNQAILSHLSQKIEMQLRPLHMVLMKMSENLPLYAHCLGIGTKPRITITTHMRQDNSLVWYLGGQLAEEGINYSSQKQAKMAKIELHALFPWINFNEAEFASFFVNRAEPLQKNRLKPETSFLKIIHNMMIGWPVKLALTPILVQNILHQIIQIKTQPTFSDTRALRSWPIPPLARPIWEEAFCKSVA